MKKCSECASLFEMSLAKIERNKDIVLKRKKDAKKWTWGELGKLYNLHRSRVHHIYMREVDKSVVHSPNVARAL